MAYYFIDNVYTKSFTPKEYQVELLDSAKDHNIIACVGNGPNKTFVALKLIQELSNAVRRPFKNGGLRTLYLTATESVVTQFSTTLRYLTDLSVGEYIDCNEDVNLDRHQVLVMTCDACWKFYCTGSIAFNFINLLIVDECHYAIRDHVMKQVVEVCLKTPPPTNLRVVGITSPLLPGPGGVEPGRLEAEIQRLEGVLHCTAETASDIVSVLRYCSKPREVLIECDNFVLTELCCELEQHINETQMFLEDHRYDPSEIYDDEFSEDIREIPDPKIDPLQILQDFREVLTTMGPFCADKAAHLLLIKIEKLKVKTPYERHFLLLCVVSSVMIKIRAICDNIFEKYSEKERIYNFSSPKILRLIEVIRQFKPKRNIVEDKDVAKENDVTNCNENNVESSNADNKLKNDSTLIINNEKCNEMNNYNLRSNNLNSIQNNLSLDINKHNVVLNNMLHNSDNNFIDDNNCCIKNMRNIKNENCDNCNVKNDLVNRSVSNGNDCVLSNSDVECKNNLNCCDNNKIYNDNPMKINENNIAMENGIAPMSEDAPPVSTPEDSALTWELSGRTGGRWRGKGRGWRYQRRNQQPPHNRFKFNSLDDADNLCGIIFVENRFTAKILSHLLNDLRRHDEDFSYVGAQFTVGKIADPVTEPREYELEHRKQEEVLKRFRMRECNILVGTSLLEEGIDLPKCNLVVRYDVPNNYRSYAQSKGRARAPDSHYVHLIQKKNCEEFIATLAEYLEIEKMLLRRCANQEPTNKEEQEADLYSNCIKPYKPKEDSDVSVSMTTAVTLVNRYCAKLPSDTFTRLTPMWWVERIFFCNQDMYFCTIRLPINSPVKQDIVGHPMPTHVLSRRIAALETCKVLHQAKELDDNLQPIGKESFQTLDSPGEIPDPEEPPPQLWDTEPRPGTTKRRQYYYKRIASSLNDCRPVVGVKARLYHLEMILTCPLPEEQNTRGRKLHPPEDSPQGFGILTLKEIPKICPFPIFTRSGEVRVSLELSTSDIILNEEQLEKISIFLNFTFTSVLRLQKYLMMFDPNTSENSYLVVPTRKNESENIEVDWEFLDIIFKRREEVPHNIPDEDRKDFFFEPAKYIDAVVMPWYRNQDQPQYFYVAEICNHLNPKSAFPGSDYKTFEEYYLKKYGIQIQNTQQPLLDVDHTSARLNFLTPRYVNRKGVALPTSSEETKRAKRENLEQKQILVPELCMVHPFPASLWRKAVCLPCMLYRINALLLADEIRTTVANEIALGLQTLSADFQWKPLDFGWSLADVLKKSKEENEKAAALKSKNYAKIFDLLNKEESNNEKDVNESSEKKDVDETVISKENKSNDKMEDCSKKSEVKEGNEEVVDEKEIKEKKKEDLDDEDDIDEKDGTWMEIGTWSNDMADMAANGEFDQDVEFHHSFSTVRYGSPSWEVEGGIGGMLDFYDSDVDSDDSDDEIDYSSETSDVGRGGLRIEFKNDYLAEAVDDDADLVHSLEDEADWEWKTVDDTVNLEKEVELENRRFQEAIERNKICIKESSMFLPHDISYSIKKNEEITSDNRESRSEEKQLGFEHEGYAMIENVSREVTDSGIFIDKSSDELYTPSENTDFSSDDENSDDKSSRFSFDSQPELNGHPGPSPSLLLQALTMSNANDGINLERLETIGDSFLKFAITTYLYCTYDAVHEGKLSHLRSKQVSNLNLYRLGKRKIFGESMIATKFEPHDNWLPPCYFVPKELERALIEAGVPACQWNQAELPAMRDLTSEEINALVKERGELLQGTGTIGTINYENLPCFVPYNLITQHSIPDKSIADCVEALIGAYLIACGPRGALIFMSWLGINVLPKEEINAKETEIDISDRPVGTFLVNDDVQIRYGWLKPPRSPLLRHVSDPEGELEKLLDGFEIFERNLRYRFHDRSYLLQAMTHASYSTNRLTDCYQRLEFLGDAVLDYLITRHLYEDKRQHCPGALTDLRSALVNNTIFASLAVRHGFHKFFRHLSPGLAEVVERFVRIQEENNHVISEEFYLIGEDECEEAEDVEVPKALGDVFESVAGAIFLDSKMSLDAVWLVYHHMMKNEIELFSTNVPKSPIRELLELEPETAKFGKPEKLADGRRVRVTVEVFGKGAFKGIGRNYRIAKCTAAKCALKQLKKRGLLAKKFSSQR
ncbi:endoribonuclease Dcr-1 isoform X2 [Lycorma delicatula]